MHYFKDRSEAGRLLAEKIKAKGGFYVNPAVIALNEGGVLVGAELARTLHATMYILETENIDIPGEGTAGIASSEGNFTYSSMYSAGQVEEMKSDYHQVIDQERLRAFQKLNRIIGRDGVIKKQLLKRHEIILVSDGLKDPLKLEIAVDYLKPIAARKIIIATPIATLPVVDRMHLAADELFCLGVIDNYMTTDHYYEENNLPTHEQAVDITQKIVLNW